jgi:hypothetical protein
VCVIALCVNGRVKTAATTATLSLVLALAAGQALAAGADATPGLSPRFATRAEFSRQPPPARAQGTFRQTRNGATMPATQQIRERALQGLLSDGPEASFEDAPRDGQLNLRFHRRGNAFKDLQGSYREMCNRVSQKIWDEPNGKKVRFDVAGKPGFGVEIPIGRSKR